MTTIDTETLRRRIEARKAAGLTAAQVNARQKAALAETRAARQEAIRHCLEVGLTGGDAEVGAAIESYKLAEAAERELARRLERDVVRWIYANAGIRK